jgi:hypothetical protein
MKEYVPNINENSNLSEIREEVVNQAEYLRQFSQHINKLFEMMGSKIKPTENDGDNKLKDLIEYAKNQVEFRIEDGEKTCPICQHSVSGCFPVTKVKGSKILYGVRCCYPIESYQKFHEFGEVPIPKSLQQYLDKESF